MYEMMREPPPPGSPVESVMLLVWRMRQDREYNAIRVFVQAAIDPDQGKSTQDAWKEFSDTFFPYLKGQKRRGDKAAIDYLMKEVSRGPLTVKPLVPLVKSRLRGTRRPDARDNDNDMPPMRVGKGGRRRGRR
jgi:hypothetical protein